MARRPSKPPPKDLRDLWAEIPEVECKQKCSDCCGPIALSNLERELMEARAGKKLEALGACMDCSMLRNGLCSVYSLRPVVCRLWGVTPALKCPHGCEPERWVSDREAMDLLLRANEIGGGEDFGPLEPLRELLDTLPPEEIQAFSDYVKEGERNRAAILKANGR